MAHDLYSDAILEAKKLRTMAEEAAKNRIIDAVTPRIRRLIENQLLIEGDDLIDDEPPEDVVDDIELPEEPDAMSADTAPLADDLGTSDLAAALGSVIDTPVEQPGTPYTEPAADAGVGPKISIGADGEIEIEVDGLSIEVEKSEGSTDDGLMLDQPVAEALSSALGKLHTRRKLSAQINAIHEKIDFLKRALTLAKQDATVQQRKRVSNIFEALARKVISLKRQAILSEQNGVSVNEEKNKLDTIIEEMDQMSRHNRSGRGNRSIFDFLFEDSVEEAGGLEEGDEELEAEETEEGAEEVDVDAASTALEDLGAALGLDVAIGEEGEEDFEDLEADEDVEEEVELPEADVDEVYEIDEVALRRELRRLRRLDENDPVDGSGDSSFGGGEAGDEPFIEVDEEDLLNALADELGDAPTPSVGADSASGTDAMTTESRRRLARLRTRRSTTRSSSQRTPARAANRQIKEYKRVVGALKGQLTEMNLFNAKLLYANKLMQNRDLTPRQQRAIVEALDNAKTLREAKLLYKSLTTSLNKRGRSSGRLSEGVVRARGSSSVPTRTAQPANNGVGEKDRWAVLAGLENN